MGNFDITLNDGKVTLTRKTKSKVAPAVEAPVEPDPNTEVPDPAPTPDPTPEPDPAAKPDRRARGTEAS